MKTLVISAVNLTEGGGFTVMKNCVAAAAGELPGWRIILLAHDATLIDIPRVEILSFPGSKNNWFKRIFLEWYAFEKLSQTLSVDLWLSLHDITPRVKAKRQAVYCHNPSPFSRATWRDSFFDPKYFAFTLFYGYLYSCFLKRNYAVIVQQEWLRREFIHRYRIKEVVVANPDSSIMSSQFTTQHVSSTTTKQCIFLYPALPRCFKNFEVIGEAVEILERSGTWAGLIRWTLDGTENRYSRWLFRRFGGLRTIQWIGRQSNEEMLQQYSVADCLVFPSRVETWGLPISEAKQFGLPLIVADLPYAHETVGSWDRVSFISPHEPKKYAECMASFARGGNPFKTAHTHEVVVGKASSWSELLSMLTHDL